MSLTNGPFARSGHVVQNHTSQVARWDFQNEATHTSPPWPSCHSRTHAGTNSRLYPSTHAFISYCSWRTILTVIFILYSDLQIVLRIWMIHSYLQHLKALSETPNVSWIYPSQKQPRPQVEKWPPHAGAVVLKQKQDQLVRDWSPMEALDVIHIPG